VKTKKIYSRCRPSTTVVYQHGDYYFESIAFEDAEARDTLIKKRLNGKQHSSGNKKLDPPPGSRLSSQMEVLTSPLTTVAPLNTVTPAESETPLHPFVSPWCNQSLTSLSPLPSLSSSPAESVMPAFCQTRLPSESLFQEPSPLPGLSLPTDPLSVALPSSPWGLRSFTCGKLIQLNDFCRLHEIHDVHDELFTHNMDVLLRCAAAAGDDLHDQELVRRFIDLIVEFWDRNFEGSMVNFEDDDGSDDDGDADESDDNEDDDDSEEDQKDNYESDNNNDDDRRGGDHSHDDMDDHRKFDSDFDDEGSDSGNGGGPRSQKRPRQDVAMRWLQDLAKRPVIFLGSSPASNCTLSTAKSSETELSNLQNGCNEQEVRVLPCHSIELGSNPNRVNLPGGTSVMRSICFSCRAVIDHTLYQHVYARLLQQLSIFEGAPQSPDDLFFVRRIENTSKRKDRVSEISISATVYHCGGTFYERIGNDERDKLVKRFLSQKRLSPKPNPDFDMNALMQNLSLKDGAEN
jgi:hypothetical protein